MKPKRILVDMDGVLADFMEGFRDEWRHRVLSEHHHYFDGEQKSFNLKEHLPKELHSRVDEVCTSMMFFELLPVIDGAVEAVRGMVQLGYDVRICSSPWYTSDYCEPEKRQWIVRELGKEFLPRVIFTNDKTLIRADFLIDDKPEIHGTDTPDWEHLLFTQPYNKHITGKRRLTWDNWREVLG